MSVDHSLTSEALSPRKTGTSSTFKTGFLLVAVVKLSNTGISLSMMLLSDAFSSAILLRFLIELVSNTDAELSVSNVLGTGVVDWTDK